MPTVLRSSRPRITAAAAAAIMLASASLLFPAGARAEQRGDTGLQQAPDPLVIIVSLTKQRLTVFDRSGVVTKSPVSSGQPEFPTPTGIFSIIGKEIEHESNIYEGASMPYMERLTWSGTALHAGNLPGYPASHGCIRLPYGFSQKLYDITKINTRVIVTHDDVAPQPISHPRLFTPLPGDEAPAMASVATSRIASLAGITPALAAEPLTGNQLPLSAKAKARFAATAELYQAIKPAEIARAAVWEKVKAANVALMGAKRVAEAANEAVDVALDGVKEIKRTKKAAEAKLAQVMRKADGRITPETIDALAKAEDAAEQRVIEESDKLDAALDQVEALKAGIPDLDAKVAEAEAARRALDDDLRAANQAVKDAQGAYALAKREDARYMKPVSVFISRKDQRIYVRQGFDPVLEAPVTITNPEQPFGTHLYTAMGANNGALEWSVISFPSATHSEQNRRAKAGVAARPSTASKVLDRISYPEETLEAIREIVRPGSSLIISDDSTSEHFGNGTDFVVAVR